MTAKTKSLSETFKFSDAIPRKLQNKDLSTKSKMTVYYGTYQQVINTLDSEGVPEHKVKGFAFTGSGTCAVVVHKH